MKSKKIRALIAATIVMLGTAMAYAADDQTTDDENTIVGACMEQKFKEKVPPVLQDKIAKCGDVDSNAVAKCLGLGDDEYLSFAKFCVAQLVNAKCVSAKMKVSLMQYADCGYEKDPVACYKTLGFTVDSIVKLSTDCQKEAASQ